VSEQKLNRPYKTASIWKVSELKPDDLLEYTFPSGTRVIARVVTRKRYNLFLDFGGSTDWLYWSDCRQYIKKVIPNE
jgi:hypothetical protein